MIIDTQDTNYSAEGVVINTQHTNYSIGGVVIKNSEHLINASERWQLTLRTIITPPDGS